MPSQGPSGRQTTKDRAKRRRARGPRPAWLSSFEPVAELSEDPLRGPMVGFASACGYEKVGADIAHTRIVVVEPKLQQAGQRRGGAEGVPQSVREGAHRELERRGGDQSAMPAMSDLTVANATEAVREW